MSEEEFGLFRDIWHIGTDMMCQDYVKPAYRLKEKIIATFKENQELEKENQEWINLLEMFKNQQKEFIDWLEENWKTTQDIWYIKILQKYKEIIGAENEN